MRSLHFMHTASDFPSYFECFWLQEPQSTGLRGEGKAHWTPMSQFVDLGELFWHLTELLQNSVDFFTRCFEEHMEQNVLTFTLVPFFWDSFKKIKIQNFLSGLP